MRRSLRVCAELIGIQLCINLRTSDSNCKPSVSASMVQLHSTSQQGREQQDIHGQQPAVCAPLANRGTFGVVPINPCDRCRKLRNIIER